MIRRLHSLRRSLEKYLSTRGVVGTLKVIMTFPYYWLRQYPDRRRLRIVNARERSWDVARGVTTARIVRLQDLDIASPNWRFGQAHAVTPAERFERIMRDTSIDCSRFTFLDFGSGLGRVVLLASEYPFRQVIGVEFARQLHEAAQRNIRDFPAALKRCADVRVVLADATDFPLPADPLVCYFYNPFGPEVMSQVIQNIEESLKASPRDIYIVYVNAQHRSLIERSSAFLPMTSTPEYRIYRSRPVAILEEHAPPDRVTLDIASAAPPLDA